MSFDRKAYKQATLAALAASRTYNREDALIEMLLNEAEARHNAEIRSAATVSPREPYKDATEYHYRHFTPREGVGHWGEYAPTLREDLERVRQNPSLKGTPSDPDNGAYCGACGHYHFGMC
jgi:hypothetical protein